MKKLMNVVASMLALGVSVSGCGSKEQDAAVAAQIQNSHTQQTQKAANESHKNNAIVIDVRTLAEWNNGHLSNAVFLPMDQLSDKISVIVPDKNQPVILYCQSGNRAGRMMNLMKEQGYTQVVNAGGVDDAAALTGERVVK
jgi:rhodanese-related sulfurtransferase